MLILILLGFLSCSNNKKEITRGEIEPKELLKYNKDKNLDEYYEKLKDLAYSKKLNGTFDSKNSNLLMLALNNDLDEKYKLSLFFDTLAGMLLEQRNYPKYSFEEIFEPKDIEDYNESADINKIENLRIYREIISFSSDDVKNLLNYVNNEGKSVIFYAVDKGIKPLVDLLINVVNLSIVIKDGKDGKENKNLLRYIISERPSLLKYFYLKGYLNKFDLNPNVEINTNLKDPLILAIINGNIEAVKILLKAGCHPDSKDENKNKAILVAANIGNYEIVDILIAAGAKVLSADDIKKRKAENISVKTLTILGKMISESVSKIAPIGNTAFNPSPLSDEISKIRQHTIPRTKLYTRIYKRFLKGYWLKLIQPLVNGKLIYYYVELLLEYTKDSSLKPGTKTSPLGDFSNFIEKVSEKIINTIDSSISDTKEKIENRFLNKDSLKSNIDFIEKELKDLEEEYKGLLTLEKEQVLQSIKNDLQKYQVYENSPIIKLNNLLKEIFDLIRNSNVYTSKSDYLRNIQEKSLKAVEDLKIIDNNIKMMYNKIVQIKNYIGE